MSATVGLHILRLQPKRRSVPLLSVERESDAERTVQGLAACICQRAAEIDHGGYRRVSGVGRLLCHQGEGTDKQAYAKTREYTVTNHNSSLRFLGSNTTEKT